MSTAWNLANGQRIHFTETHGETIEGYWLDDVDNPPPMPTEVPADSTLGRLFRELREGE